MSLKVTDNRGCSHTGAYRKQFDIGPAKSPLPFPPLHPFRSKPLNYTARGLGSAVSSPSRAWAELKRKSNLVHFSLKIWHLVASNLLIFLRINWPMRVHFFRSCSCSFHVHESWHYVNMKILVCQIIGPAAAGSAGPVNAPASQKPWLSCWAEKYQKQTYTASMNIISLHVSYSSRFHSTAYNQTKT